MITVLFVSALFLLILTLLFLLLPKKNKKPGLPIAKPSPKLTNCPLCGSGLDGKKLYSKLITYPDHRQTLEIRGCTTCYKEGNVKARICPSCKRKLEAGDIVFASYEQKDGITRVVIKGCKRCDHNRTSPPDF